MTIEEYIEQHSNALVWQHGKIQRAVLEGMLLFDDTAYCLAGPFEGGYAYYCIKSPGDSLLTAEQHFQQYRFNHRILPWRFTSKFRQPALNEIQLQKRLKELTPKELKEWEQNVKRYKTDVATVEKPFALYIAGNDDSTWTKFFATLEDAKSELKLLEMCQPINYILHIVDNGFVFTN
jgi:hypothetical protein